MRKVAGGFALAQEHGGGLGDIISRYAQTFLLLQRYDNGALTEPSGTLGGELPAVDAARRAIRELKAELVARGEAGDLFGLEREDGLAAILAR